MRIQPCNLEAVFLQSHQWQDQIKHKFGHLIAQFDQHYDNLHVDYYSERLKDLILKIVRIVHERIVVHPYVEKCQAHVRHVVLVVYKKAMPYLAQLSENSLMAGGLGLCVGVTFSWYVLSAYYESYYGKIIKTRLMSGVTFNEKNYGGLESISLRSDLIVPRITSPNEILIRIHAASVDMIDIAILSGLGRTERRIKKKSKSSTTTSILGRDFSGVVLDVGSKVDNVEVGDAVWGALPLASSGSLSEFIVVDGKSVQLKPSNINFDGAATLPFSCLQVLDSFVHEGYIAPHHGLHGKSLLVIDGGSPTGVCGIQLAKAWKGHVTACVTARVVPLVKLLGADRVISLPHDPERAEAMCEEAFANDYFDYCLITTQDWISEAFCSEISNKVIKSYSPRRIASDGYGFFRTALLSYWRKIWRSKYQDLDTSKLEMFKQLVEAGKLQPVLDSQYAYEQSEEAFQSTATTSSVGKKIITFGLRGQQHQRDHSRNSAVK